MARNASGVDTKRFVKKDCCEYPVHPVNPV